MQEICIVRKGLDHIGGSSENEEFYKSYCLRCFIMSKLILADRRAYLSYLIWYEDRPKQLNNMIQAYNVTVLLYQVLQSPPLITTENS